METKEVNMKTIEYNKLVRDKIPKIIESDSKECTTKIVSGKEKLEYLYKKLGEETAELSEANSIEELADVQEVINAIAKELGISLEELESVRKSKANKRGGFDNGIVLLNVKEK